MEILKEIDILSDILDTLDPDLLFDFTGNFISDTKEKVEEFIVAIAPYKLYFKLITSLILLGITIFRLTQYGARAETNLRVALMIKIINVVFLVFIIVLDFMKTSKEKSEETDNK